MGRELPFPLLASLAVRNQFISDYLPWAEVNWFVHDPEGNLSLETHAVDFSNVVHLQ